MSEAPEPTLLAVVADELDMLAAMVGRVEAAGTGVDAFTMRALSEVPTLAYRYMFVVASRVAELELVRRVAPRATLIVVSPRVASVGDLTELWAVPQVAHVVVGAVQFEMLGTIAYKLVSGDYFGLEKYLDANAVVTLHRMHDYAGRQQAVDDVMVAAAAKGARRSVASSIAQVADELLMNALYDAPVDAQGLAVFAHVLPKQRVHMPSPKPVSLRFATSEGRFWVAVRDRYGGLRKPVVLDYIRRGIATRGAMEEKQAGAGLGLYLIAHAVGAYVVNVAPGIATEVVCSFDLKGKSQLRLLGMFEFPAASAREASLPRAREAHAPGLAQQAGLANEDSGGGD